MIYELSYERDYRTMPDQPVGLTAPIYEVLNQILALAACGILMSVLCGVTNLGLLIYIAWMVS